LPLANAQVVFFIFEKHTTGLPDEILERYRNRLVKIPMLSPRVRSLNLSTSVALGLYEVLRQRSVP
jgi:tRNA (cytidine/uridine-2'-O-)-methyltransferase